MTAASAASLKYMKKTYLVDIQPPRVSKFQANAEILMPREEARNLAKENGLPGPGAPATDRKEYGELTREEKVSGIRIKLARQVYNNGQYNASAVATVKDVQNDFFDGNGSDSHIRDLMEVAAEATGYRFSKPFHGGPRRLETTPDDVTDSEVLSHLSGPGDGTTETSTTPTGGDADVHAEVDTELNALMNAEPATTSTEAIDTPDDPSGVERINALTRGEVESSPLTDGGYDPGELALTRWEIDEHVLKQRPLDPPADGGADR